MNRKDEHRDAGAQRGQVRALFREQQLHFVEGEIILFGFGLGWRSLAHRVI